MSEQDPGYNGNNYPDNDPGFPKGRPVLGTVHSFDLDNHERGYYAQHGKHFNHNKGKLVYHQPDEWGYSQLGLEFREGNVVEWSKILSANRLSLDDLTAVIYASGSNEEHISASGTDQYVGFIAGGKLYEVIKKGGETLVTVSELPDQLPNLRIGQRFGEFKLNSVEIAGEKVKLDEREIKKALEVAQGKRGVKASEEQKMYEQLLKQFNNPRGKDPFTSVAELVEEHKDDPPYLHYEPDWVEPREFPQEDTEELEESDLLEEAKDEIAKFTKQFLENRAYVPSPNDFERIQELAKHIIIDSNGLRYVYTLTDGREIPYGEIFVRNSRSSRWLLTDFEEGNLAKAREQTTPTPPLDTRVDPGLEPDRENSVHRRKLFNQRRREEQREASVMLVEDFRQALEEAGELDSREGENPRRIKAIDRELGRKYKTYIDRHIALSKSIKERTGRDRKTGKDKVLGEKFLRRDVNTDSSSRNVYTKMERDLVAQRAEDERRRVEVIEKERKKIKNRVRRYLRGEID